MITNKLNSFYEGTNGRWYAVIDSFTTKNADTKWEHVDHDRYPFPAGGAESFEDLQKEVKRYFDLDLSKKYVGFCIWQ